MSDQATAKKPPVVWGFPDAETLCHTEKYDAIEEILDCLDDPLPETIVVAGFARMEIEVTAFCHPLEALLERLDEDYGDPDGEPTKPTATMEEAERVFLEAIKKEYDVWQCQEVCRETINVAEWIEANRPDWNGMQREGSGVQPGPGGTETQKAEESKKTCKGAPTVPQTHNQAPASQTEATCPGGERVTAPPGDNGQAPLPWHASVPALGKLNPETGERSPIPAEDEGTHPLF